MESLASGTPVVALRTPALTELIEHGRTGYLVSTVDEMSEAFRHLEQLSSDPCRRTAQARCCVRRMAGQYLGLYETLALRTEARGGTLPYAGRHDGGSQLGA